MKTLQKFTFLFYRRNNEDNINISISNASKLTKNMNISISMTSDPVAPQLASAGTLAGQTNVVGGGLKASQPCPPNGSPLVDLIDTDSDDCELERKKEDAAVVKFSS